MNGLTASSYTRESESNQWKVTLEFNGFDSIQDAKEFGDEVCKTMGFKTWFGVVVTEIGVRSSQVVTPNEDSCN